MKGNLPTNSTDEILRKQRNAKHYTAFSLSTRLDLGRDGESKGFNSGLYEELE
jgi:hypothetical protein